MEIILDSNILAKAWNMNPIIFRLPIKLHTPAYFGERNHAKLATNKDKKKL